MNIEIIRMNGDLRRELWRFSLSISPSGGTIYFDYWAFQTKESTRHKKWVSQNHWERLMRRENTIDNPPLPDYVETEVRKTFASKVASLIITR